MPLSLSTAWLQGRHRDAVTLLDEASELGFTALELYALSPGA